MKKFSVACALLGCLFALSACGGSLPEKSENGELYIRDESLNTSYVTNDNNRVFYEIFVGSFSGFPSKANSMIFIPGYPVSFTN